MELHDLVRQAFGKIVNWRRAGIIIHERPGMSRFRRFTQLEECTYSHEEMRSADFREIKLGPLSKE